MGRGRPVKICDECGADTEQHETWCAYFGVDDGDEEDDDLDDEIVDDIDREEWE